MKTKLIWLGRWRLSFNGATARRPWSVGLIGLPDEPHAELQRSHGPEAVECTSKSPVTSSWTGLQRSHGPEAVEWRECLIS